MRGKVVKRSCWRGRYARDETRDVARRMSLATWFNIDQISHSPRGGHIEGIIAKRDAGCLRMRRLVINGETPPKILILRCFTITQYLPPLGKSPVASLPPLWVCTSRKTLKDSTPSAGLAQIRVVDIVRWITPRTLQDSRECVSSPTRSRRDGSSRVWKSLRWSYLLES